MKKVRSLFGFCFLMLSIGHAQVKIETISFESTNPFSLRDIIKDLDRQETQTVFGRLTSLLIAYSQIRNIRSS